MTTLTTLTQVTGSSLPEAAQLYIQAGLPVFPLEPRGKSPLIPRGFYSASTQRDIVQAWWKRWPHANIGIPTGRASGWWVLDVDPAHGGLTSLAHLERQGHEHWHETLTTTLMQHTGGNGAHLVYQMRQESAGIHLTNAAGFAGYAGLDLRVQGGYIVAAPSLHRSGGCYRWQPANDIAPFPELLLTLFREHRQRQYTPRSTTPHATQSDRDRETDPEYWLHCALKHAVPGRRHNYACFLACHLVDDVGLTRNDAAWWMEEYVALIPQCSQDQFTPEEALDCLSWAFSRAT